MPADSESFKYPARTNAITKGASSCTGSGQRRCFGNAVKTLGLLTNNNERRDDTRNLTDSYLSHDVYRFFVDGGSPVLWDTAMSPKKKD